jgi:acetyltransferase-like isoleucine patch superfamily enzyme
MPGTVEHLLHFYSRVKTRLFSALIAGQFRKTGKGCRVAAPFRFYGLDEITLGDHVSIERDCWIQTIPGKTSSGESKLFIGSNSGIGMGASISAARRVFIGEHVLLGRNVYISDHAHAFADIQIPIMNQGISGIADVEIGRGTWLGQNVVVLPGVKIGEHCVIGANSVVKSNISSYSVAVGAPARVVRAFDCGSREWQRLPSR